MERYKNRSNTQNAQFIYRANAKEEEQQQQQKMA
jgi:hypothetical protein